MTCRVQAQPPKKTNPKCPSCGCLLRVSTDGKIELPLVLLAGHEPLLPKGKGDPLARFRSDYPTRFRSLCAVLAKIGRMLGFA